MSDPDPSCWEIEAYFSGEDTGVVFNIASKNTEVVFTVSCYEGSCRAEIATGLDGVSLAMLPKSLRELATKIESELDKQSGSSPKRKRATTPEQ